MAIEKKLNTRIQLKYDTYAGWTDTSVANQGANLVLKPGEIGICAIPSGSTAVNGDAARPQIMFKVGDAEGSPFSALPWASAKAADVYGWAKAAGLTVEKSGNGNVVSNIKWENNKIVFETASVATSEGLEGLQNRVAALEENFASDVELAAAVATLNGNIAALANGAVKTNTDTIAAIKDGTTIDSFADVEAALENKQEAGDYATSQDLTNLSDSLKAIATTGNAADVTIADAAGKIEATNVENALAELATNIGTNATAITTLTNGAVKDNTDAIAAINNETTGILAQAKAYADANDANATYAISYDSVNKEIVLTGANGGETTKFSASAFIKDGMLSNAEYNTTTNKLTLTWNTDAGIEEMEIDLNDLVDTYTGSDAIEVSTAGVISVKAGSIGDTQLDAATKASLAKADTALQAQSLEGYATETFVTTAIEGLDSATSALSGEDYAITSVTITDGKITGRTEKEFATKAYVDQAETDANAYADSLAGNYATAAQGALAATAVQPAALNDYYTKTAADAEFMNATKTDDAIDAKIEALNLAETYATVAQGTKADTALQTVAAGTGLKVSEKADNSQTIEIDDTVVFVLNCGSASEVI